jgi:hypothetical protein
MKGGLPSALPPADGLRDALAFPVTAPPVAGKPLVWRPKASRGLSSGHVGRRCRTARRSGTAFLASQDAGFVTGQIIYAVGGQRGPIRVG